MKRKLKFPFLEISNVYIAIPWFGYQSPAGLISLVYFRILQILEFGKVGTV